MDKRWILIGVVTTAVFCFWCFYPKALLTSHQQAYNDAFNHLPNQLSSLASQFMITIDGIDPTKSVPTVRTSGGVEFCAVFPPLADRTRFQYLDLRLFSVTDSGAASDRSSFRLIANCRSICATDPLMEHPKKKKVWFRRVDPGKYLVRYYLVRMPGSPEDGSFPENLLVGESQLVVEK